MTEDTRKIKWIACDDTGLAKCETVKQAVDTACRIVDKTFVNTGECLNGLLKTEDGELYTIEAVIMLIPVTKEDAVNDFCVEEEDLV